MNRKKFIRKFMLAGLTVPILSLLVFYIGNVIPETYYTYQTVRGSASIAVPYVFLDGINGFSIILWPSSIMLMAFMDAIDPGIIYWIVIVISITINIYLYRVIGILIWKGFYEKKDADTIVRKTFLSPSTARIFLIIISVLFIGWIYLWAPTYVNGLRIDAKIYRDGKPGPMPGSDMKTRVN